MKELGREKTGEFIWYKLFLISVVGGGSAFLAMVWFCAIKYEGR